MKELMNKRMRALIEHTATRTYAAVGIAALLVLCAPPRLQAQQTSVSRPPTARTRTVTVSTGGRCSELTSSPTMLLQAPEGRALLRFKQELNDAAGVIEQRSDSNKRVDIERITRVQRGVDSLMRIVVGFNRADGSDGKAPGRLFFSLEQSIRAAVPGMDSTFRAIAPQIEAAIRSLQPQVMALSDAARMHLPMRITTPSGWLGMHLSESKITIMSDEGALTNYCDYPVIEAVDAGSPAEKSGLNSGDTVVAYNGRDVLKLAVNYAELLVPGQLIRMRVKHANRSREVSVTVAPRPQVERGLERNMVFMRSPCAPGTVCDRAAGQFTFTPPMATPPAAAELAAASGIAVLAGAQLSIIDDEFAQGIGVDGPGALVLRAPLGTPAADAGLRAGDVIRLVNGQPVRELAPLRRAFSMNGSREVKLTVSSRGSPSRVVVVKW